MLTTLALSDGWVIGIAAVNLIVSIVMALGLVWINSRLRKAERTEEELKQAASELVSSKIDQVSGKLGSQLERINERFADALGRVEQRLADGDALFDRLSERAQKIELAFNQGLSALREVIAASRITRDEFNDATKTVNARIIGIEQRVSALEGQHHANHGGKR